jgi:hypothetical protein
VFDGWVHAVLYYTDGEPFQTLMVGDKEKETRWERRGQCVGAAGLRANAKVCSARLTEGHTGVDTEKETRWERRGQCVGARRRLWAVFDGWGCTRFSTTRTVSLSFPHKTKRIEAGSSSRRLQFARHPASALYRGAPSRTWLQSLMDSCSYNAPAVIRSP